MILIGGLGSPFVRRVAITLRVYGIAFEHRPLSAAKPDERVQLHAINPLVRVPALVTEDVGTLVDSGTILDYLDRLVGPEKALMPAGGPERNADLGPDPALSLGRRRRQSLPIMKSVNGQQRKCISRCSTSTWSKLRTASTPLSVKRKSPG